MGPKCHHKGPYKREAEGDSGQRKRLCDITSSRSEGGGRDQEPRQPGALLQTPEPILPWSLCGHGALPPLVSAPERCFQTSDLQNYMRININMCCFKPTESKKAGPAEEREGRGGKGKEEAWAGEETRPGARGGTWRVRISLPRAKMAFLVYPEGHWARPLPCTGDCPFPGKLGPLETAS